MQRATAGSAPFTGAAVVAVLLGHAFPGLLEV